MSDETANSYPIERLEEFSRRVFAALGFPAGDAQQSAEILAQSDVRGIESHGVARLRMYYELFRAGRINPRPVPLVVRETPSTATVDGDAGLGLVVGPWANELAMSKAEAVGSGWVSVGNTNHFGIAGYYPMQAAARDLIGWAMTNASCLVAPMWGAERRLGTNPIAVAFPAGEEPPIVIDMATAAVAFGKIQIALRRGESIPLGWAVDRDGRPTTDPTAMVDGGALAPLGSERERGGHKGYALAAMVDILSSMLSGANWGPFVPPSALREIVPERSVGRGIGHFFGALSVAGFIDPDEFKRQLDDWIRTMRATRPAEGTAGVLVPGDPERAAEAIRRREGVPLDAAVVEDLRFVGRELGIPFD